MNVVKSKRKIALKNKFHLWFHRQGTCFCGCNQRIFVRGYGRICVDNLKQQLEEQGYKLTKKRAKK